MQILRRRLLLALAASPWLNHAAAAPKANSADVIVLGAGMSGLNCARELRQLGYSVMVLEARDRIGGRIWTDNTLGVPLDLGGAWIHGVKGNPLTRLVSARLLQRGCAGRIDAGFRGAGGTGRQQRIYGRRSDGC